MDPKSTNTANCSFFIPPTQGAGQACGERRRLRRGGDRPGSGEDHGDVQEGQERTGKGIVLVFFYEKIDKFLCGTVKLDIVRTFNMSNTSSFMSPSIFNLIHCVTTSKVWRSVSENLLPRYSSSKMATYFPKKGVFLV